MKMKVLRSMITLIFILCFEKILLAQELRQEFTSSSRAKIVFNYSFEKDCLKYSDNSGHMNALKVANPVQISVYGVNTLSAATAEVEFWAVSTVYHGGAKPELFRVYNHYDRIVSLASASNSLTGNLEKVAVRLSNGGAATDYKIVQKIRVKVNNKALVDPISRTDQFLVSLDNGVACFNL